MQVRRTRKAMGYATHVTVVYLPEHSEEIEQRDSLVISAKPLTPTELLDGIAEAIGANARILTLVVYPGERYQPDAS